MSKTLNMAQACCYRVCGNCGIQTESRLDKLQSCTGCYHVAYCCHACQREHWKPHKKGVRRAS